MRIFRTIALVSSLFVAAPAVSMASDLNPWTKCGIGAMLFDETPWAAASSNIIWDLGTTAVTSAGTSENTCDGKDVQAAIFIQETYANLEEETAKGNGQHLTAMLNIMGCDTAVHSDIIQSVRSDFASTVNNAGYGEKSVQDKAESYYTVVKSKVDAKFSHQCNIG